MAKDPFEDDPLLPAVDADGKDEASEESAVPDPLAEMLGDAGEIIDPPAVPEKSDEPDGDPPAIPEKSDEPDSDPMAPLPPEPPEEHPESPVVLEPFPQPQRQEEPPPEPVGIEPIPGDPLATAEPKPTTTGPQPGMSLRERSVAAGGKQVPRAAPGFSTRGDDFAQPQAPEQPFDSADVEDTETFDPDDPFRGTDQPAPEARLPGEPPPQAVAPGAALPGMGNTDELKEAVLSNNKELQEMKTSLATLVTQGDRNLTFMETLITKIEEINTGFAS